MFAFLSDLVERGILSEAFLSFLMKGHTHTDIDQVFGWIADELKSYTGIPTMSEYRQVSKGDTSSYNIATMNNNKSDYMYESIRRPCKFILLCFIGKAVYDALQDTEAPCCCFEEIEQCPDWKVRTLINLTDGRDQPGRLDRIVYLLHT